MEDLALVLEIVFDFSRHTGSIGIFPSTKDLDLELVYSRPRCMVCTPSITTIQRNRIFTCP